MLKWPDKDPNEVLDYDMDWTDYLAAEGDTIASSTWIIVLGDIVLNSNTFTTNIAKAWLSAGSEGTKCQLTNRITTTNTPPRTADRSVAFKIKSK